MYRNLKEAVTRLNYLFPDVCFSEADLLRCGISGHLLLRAGFYCTCYSPSKARSLQSPPYRDPDEYVKAATVRAEGLYIIPPRLLAELELTGKVSVSLAFRGEEVIYPFTDITADDIRILQSDLDEFVSTLRQCERDTTPVSAVKAVNVAPDDGDAPLATPADWQIIEPKSPDPLGSMIYNALRAIRRKRQPTPRAATVIEYFVTHKPDDFVKAIEGGIVWWGANGESKQTTNGDVQRRINRMTGKTAKK